MTWQSLPPARRRARLLKLRCNVHSGVGCATSQVQPPPRCNTRARTLRPLWQKCIMCNTSSSHTQRERFQWKERVYCYLRERFQWKDRVYCYLSCYHHTTLCRHVVMMELCSKRRTSTIFVLYVVLELGVDSGERFIHAMS